MNIEATETLAFTYNRPFHTSQRHSKLSMNHLKIWKHLGKCTNGKLPNSSLVNDRFRISTNNVKISDLLEFLLILLFSSLWSHPKTICKKVARLWKHPWGRFFFENFKKAFCFHLHLQLCKNILEWLLSREVTSCKHPASCHAYDRQNATSIYQNTKISAVRWVELYKYWLFWKLNFHQKQPPEVFCNNKPVPEQFFITKTGFLRSLLNVQNKQLDLIMSLPHFLNMWSIFERVFR